MTNSETPTDGVEAPEPRKLTEMVPPCIFVNCEKISYGTTYEHACGVRTTHYGWPLPGDGEEPLSKWQGDDARFLIDIVAEPDLGPYITNGGVALLVTDKSLRGSFFEGQGSGSSGLQRMKRVLSFVWPYAQMAEVQTSIYSDNPRLHVIIEDPRKDGQLGVPIAQRAKGAKEGDFHPGIFAMRNQAEAFGEALEIARLAYLGLPSPMAE